MAAMIIVLTLGCSETGESTLTEEEFEAMSQKEAFALLDCQASDVAREKGAETEAYISGIYAKTIETDGKPVQVILSERGYGKDCL